MNDPFALLGVDAEADDETVRKAYLQQVRLCPPERNPERFQEIRAAYEVIADARSRLALRLFHAPKPDLPALLAPVLSGGAPVPPRLPQLQALLSAAVQTFRWPSSQGKS